jgi:hypothetical protein
MGSNGARALVETKAEEAMQQGKYIYINTYQLFNLYEYINFTYICNKAN